VEWRQLPISNFVRKFPRLLSLARWVRARIQPPVSADYRELEGDQVAPVLSGLRSAWQSEDLPSRQRQLVDKQIKEFGSGVRVPVFDVFVDAVKALSGDRHGTSLLEIGCSSGYYREVLKIAGLDVAYTGCDYSKAFIALARDRYPGTPFDVEDATRLSYPDGAFDIVVSGCCLQHIPEYQTAIAETVRVARSSVIFHRTPVLVGAETAYFRKTAYGIDTFEIHFSEAELLELFRHHGLAVTRTIDLSEERLASGTIKATRTYVCALAH
jgi:SAM-dependent methyltransferase